MTRYWFDTEFMEDGRSSSSSTEHNALNDARWTKLAWERLVEIREGAP